MTSSSHAWVVCLAAALAGCGSTTASTKPDEASKTHVTTPPPATLDSLAALIADAGKLLRDGQAQEAKAKYAQVLQKEPGNFDARMGEVNADIKLGNFPQAHAALNVLRKERPDNREVVIVLGLLLKEKGDYVGGIDLYKDELHKQEQNGETPDPELLNNMIVMYRLNKDYAEAEKTCRKLLSRQPGNVDALKSLSLIYFDQEKFALAETIAVNSLKLNDSDAALYNNRGMIRVKRGRFPEAVTFFKRAVEIDPTNIAAHLNLGSIALRYRDYATASSHFGHAMKLEPRQPEANLGLGLALSGQQKANEAIAQLQRALEITPAAAEAFGEIAMITKLQLNQTAEALNWCAKYQQAKGGRLQDDDPMKNECAAIELELKNAEIIKRQQEQMRQQDEEDKKNAAPAKDAPKETPAPAPALVPEPSK